jgi:ABC-type nitrate/sulfonate/bicarbonate transport system permease component
MASPYILLSIVTSLGLGMKVSIMAEIVAGGSSLAGLGRLIYVANSIDGDTTQVMALSLDARRDSDYCRYRFTDIPR